MEGRGNAFHPQFVARGNLSKAVPEATFKAEKPSGTDFHRDRAAVNLPILQAEAARTIPPCEPWIERWAAQSAQNRTVLIYSLYLPYLRAVAAAKEKTFLI